MEIDTTGIIIGLKPYGERGVIAHVLTLANGVVSGLIRGGQVSKTLRTAGQIGQVGWAARLENHLGTMKFQPERNLAAMLLNDELGLAIMNSAFAMIADFLPEREAHADVYYATLRLLTDLPMLQGRDFKMAEYLRWETELLASIGYSLDFSKCAGCGRSDKLDYLSPKTGRAVCAECAAPYADRLMRLPLGLRELGHFFEMFAVKDLPAARKMLQV